MPHQTYPKWLVVSGDGVPFAMFLATSDPAEAAKALAASPGSRLVGVHPEHLPHVPTPHVPPGPHTP